MKRSEFLKRLGLGAVVAVAAPALLKGEEKAHQCEVKLGDECLDDVGKPKRLVFCKDEPAFISANQNFSKQYTATGCYTIDIPPLEKGEYKYELTIEDKPILSGNIKAE